MSSSTAALGVIPFTARPAGLGVASAVQAGALRRGGKRLTWRAALRAEG